MGHKKHTFMIRNSFFGNAAALTFKRWRHNGAAAFRTLGRVVHIAILPVAYTLLTFGQHAYAQVLQTNNLREDAIDSVLVTSKHRMASAQLTSPAIHIVRADELVAAGCRSVQDVLSAIPGLDVRGRGGQGMQADLQVRGGSFDQVLVLLNGVDVTDAQTGHHNLNLPIRPEAIAYIEVLSGPGGRLFGPGAYSGAINIVTKQPQGLEGEVRALAGSHGLRDGFASMAHSQQQFSVYAYGGGGSSDGFTENSDYVAYDGLVTAQLRGRWGSVDLQAGHQARSFGANAFYTPKFPNQYEATQTSLASARYSMRWGRWEADAMIGWRMNRDRFQLFREAAPAWYKGHNHHISDLYEGRLSGTYTVNGWRTRGALITRHDEILSTNLGSPITGRHRIPGFRNKYYSHFGRRTNLTVSLEEQYSWQGLRVALGAMATHNSTFGVAYGLGADVAHLWANGWRVHASANRMYRLPTFTDLYYQSPTRVGNKNLRPEWATTYEAGAGFTRDNFEARLAVYYRTGHDVIDWLESQPGSGLYRATNHANINALGGECSVSYAPNLRLLRRVSLTYSYNTLATPRGSAQGGSYVFDNLRHVAVLRTMIPVMRNLTCHATGSYRQRAGEFSELASGRMRRYPAAWLLDLRLVYTWRACNLFAEVRNVLNRQVVEFGNVPQPRRTVQAGIRYSFAQ